MLEGFARPSAQNLATVISMIARLVLTVALAFSVAASESQPPVIRKVFLPSRRRRCSKFEARPCVIAADFLSALICVHLRPSARLARVSKPCEGSKAKYSTRRDTWRRCGER